MQLLVAGGAGFIGSNFIQHILRTRPQTNVLNVDCLTYAGNLDNLKGLEGHESYRFYKGDISDWESIRGCFEGDIEAIVNFAAESHVDRSILDSSDFLRTNVAGTQVLLEAARKHGVKRFLQVSTDEVYGSLGESGCFYEDTPLSPNSPYAASKAAADLFVRAYNQTYGLETLITRCTNNYGPYQFPEKLIPLMILNAVEDKPLPVYGDGLHRRDWIHVSDHCRALESVLFQGKSGHVYNIGGGEEKPNIEVVKQILASLGKDERLIRFVTDRPGHDRRYAVSIDKIRKELDWEPTIGFEEGLEQTVEWYQENNDWVERVRSGAYREYYQRMYDRRDETLAEL